jgi:hypothetical protein
MARRKPTEKDRRDQERKKHWRAYQGTARRTIENVIFERKEKARLAKPGCVDRTLRQYQPNEISSALTEKYINSWVFELMESTVNNWNIGITSGGQTTFVKVKYHSTGQIFVQARASHATPSSHQYTWTDLQESPVTLDESDESTDLQPVAKPAAIISNHQHCQVFYQNTE